MVTYEAIVEQLAQDTIDVISDGLEIELALDILFNSIRDDVKKHIETLNKEVK